MSSTDPGSDHAENHAEDQAENTRDPQPKPSRPRAAALIFDDPLSRPSADDTDAGWGERSSRGDGAADLARFLAEKPPHHL
ncbi:hypothetical protein [Streptomyces meridianus]|uniref:Uncharacterized protein n=1 Tax=Streptomyces meridianus TaxID=2938945 RepID=A0ABT0X956_9ACTN|nr:hypothetical protein [Streptomyces meridianus]MCM2579061.1 hypothetical protein [Streptomyces meridianus]